MVRGKGARTMWALSQDETCSLMCHRNDPAPRLLSLGVMPPGARHLCCPGSPTGPDWPLRGPVGTERGSGRCAVMHLSTPRARSPVPLSPQRQRPRLIVEGGTRV